MTDETKALEAALRAAIAAREAAHAVAAHAPKAAGTVALYRQAQRVCELLAVRLEARLDAEEVA